MRFSASADYFLIDHSNEQVYIPDDGTFDFKGRAVSPATRRMLRRS